MNLSKKKLRKNSKRKKTRQKNKGGAAAEGDLHIHHLSNSILHKIRTHARNSTGSATKFGSTSKYIRESTKNIAINNYEYMKRHLDILEDCVLSINLATKINNGEEILLENIPRKLKHFRPKYLSENNDSGYLRKLIVKKSADIDINLYISRLYEIPFENMLKDIEYREHIINLVRKIPSTIFLELLISKIMELNPVATHEQIYNRLQKIWDNKNLDRHESNKKGKEILLQQHPNYNELHEKLILNSDDLITEWDLSNLNLRQLPELFGCLQINGNLVLSKNKLSSLPESFGSIIVRKDLLLNDNQLKSLPESFGYMKVGGNLRLYSNQLSSLPDIFTNDFSVNGILDLSNNQLTSLPESFGSIYAEDLWLYNNQLRSLPDSFGSITVGGMLRLDYNQLSSLPDSFGSLTVPGNLSLDNNKLSSLPDSFGSITVGGHLWLNYNQLSSLPDSFGSITVDGRLSLYGNQLQDQDIPTSFPNVRGNVRKTEGLYRNY